MGKGGLKKSVGTIWSCKVYVSKPESSLSFRSPHMILQNVFRINKTYNIHGAHPPNRAPRDRLWKRRPLQRWRQPPNLLARPGRPLRVVSPLRLALQDVWRVAIAIWRHGSADHWPHFKTHARKVWGHATLIGQLLLSCPSAECTAPARSRSSPAHHIPLHTGRFVQSC